MKTSGEIADGMTRKCAIRLTPNPYHHVDDTTIIIYQHIPIESLVEVARSSMMFFSPRTHEEFLKGKESVMRRLTELRSTHPEIFT